MEDIKIEDNGTKGRFTIYKADELAGEMTFSWAGNDKFIIDHTLVGEKFGGQGLAKKLVLAGVAYAREKSVKIIPLCSYAKSQFDRNEDLRDVLA